MKYFYLFLIALIVIVNVFADNADHGNSTLLYPATTELSNDTSKVVNVTGLTEINNHFYYFSTSESTRATWHGAIEFCKSRGMNLVTIESEDENTALEKKVKTDFESLPPEKVPTKSIGFVLWIGLNDLGKEGDFRWVSNGTEAGFTHWLLNEPNNTGEKHQPEHCVVIIAGYSNTTGWNDMDCTTEHFFICEL